MKKSEIDCRKCGACCSPQTWGCSMSEQKDGYVQLLDFDLEVMSEEYVRKHVKKSRKHGLQLACKKNHNGCVCVALRGTVGKRVSCSIYERRPHACRIFEKGGPACLETLRQIGVRIEPG
jgi:Fe-S-cluster containining protein